MKLYSSQVAPSPRKVLVFIAEKSIENIEVENLDIGKMEHKTPEYKKIAPNSRIPALVIDDGQVGKCILDHLPERLKKEIKEMLFILMLKD